ncbi:MAG TPA: helicase-associated domain-containing protein, partial [Spirochaetia bacterium]|nr:helicase-associated domain-containing protein [Spirochaetia bacterium]
MTDTTANGPLDSGRTARGNDLPLIVQGDRTILAEVASPRYPEARDALARFAELVKSPEHVHTYRLTALSIWNACASGEKADRIVELLRSLSRYPVPEHIATEITEYAGRFGSLVLERRRERLALACRDKGLADLLSADRQAALLLSERESDT